MTLAASPVGVDEERRGDAIPRQLYDLDILLASFTNSSQWEAMVAYCSARYARECETWTIDVTAGEPTAGIRDRLQLWASCSDSSSERWRTIRAVQQSQLRQQVRREPRAASRGAGVPAACGSRSPSSASTSRMAGPFGSRPSPQRHSYRPAKPSGSRTLWRSWRMQTHDRCRSSCTTSCGRCSATGRRRLPSESLTHTQRSAPPDPVSIPDGL
jgi:hypothetical protein